jgi:proline iminopeptidase
MINNFKTDKFTLQYSIEGEGPNTLVIGSAVYYSKTFSQNLRSHLRLIFMDHRGFGVPTGPIEQTDYSLDKIIDDIEALRLKLNLGKIILIGHSGHAYMAIEYAKKYPDSISRLVLIAISPSSGPDAFAASDRYFNESVCPHRKAILANNLSTMPTNGFIERMLTFGPLLWYQYDYDASALWEDVKPVPEVVDFLWGKVFRELDIRDNIDKIHVPVYLALGRYDYWNPPYLWEDYRSYFKDLSIRVFEHSAHTPQLEEQEFFDIELIDWMNKA